MVETINRYPLVLYINSLVRLSVTKVLGGGGREKPVKQRATRERLDYVILYKKTGTFMW